MALKKKSNYILKKNDEGFYTEEIPKFELPKVLYGDLDSVSSRVMTSFKEEPKGIGVLFSGIKGNSKTTTSKYVALKSELPVILVTEPFIGSEFQAFLSSIKQEIVVMFDEFEKVYNTDELQQELLPILDGTVAGKKLYLFTSNKSKVNTYLRNRPSRIYYHFKYDNLEPELVDEIIEKELHNKNHEEDLRAVLIILGTVSMDVLLKFISEVNRFDESPKKLLKGMNIEVEQKHFKVVMIINGTRFSTICDFNPIVRQEIFLEYKDEKGYHRWFSDSLVEYTMYTKAGTFIFENQNNKLMFTPFKPNSFELSENV